jgi:hypothetical protein
MRFRFVIDGYGGGSEITGNFGFAMVRETGDHGFFNSWVRLCHYRTPVMKRGSHLSWYMNAE